MQLESLQMSVIAQTSDRGQGLTQAISIRRGPGCQHALLWLPSFPQGVHTVVEAGDRCQFSGMQLEVQP